VLAGNVLAAWRQAGVSVRRGRDMNHPFNRQSFNILAKSENSIPRIVPKRIFVEFQSFAAFQ